GSLGAAGFPSAFTTRISAFGIALPIESGRRSTSSGGRYVERKASVRPYMRKGSVLGSDLRSLSSVERDDVLRKEIVHQHHARASRERGRELAEAVVEAEGEHRQQLVLGPVGQ